MELKQIKTLVKNRPAVHQLCAGGFIQESLWLKTNLLAVPLQALGFDLQADYTAFYVEDVLGAPVDEPNRQALKEKAKSALPVVTLVVFHKIDAPPTELVRVAEPILDDGRKLLSWATGNDITPFGVVTATLDNTFFHLIPPASWRRHRLGFGNTGTDFQKQLNRISSAIEEDERLSFAISILHDALRETNLQFRIARLFMCLECLAAKLKTNERPSRKAIKYLLGIGENSVKEVKVESAVYKYDTIELAGRLRDKLFHGVEFRPEDLNLETRNSYELLKKKPKILADELRSDCEIEIARWANGVSRGLVKNGIQS